MATLACALQSSPPPIVVTATPAGPVNTGPVVITATPDPTPTFAPIVTPTLPPHEGMRQGDLALRNGNYEGAVSIYWAVINDATSDPGIRSQAALNLGKAAVREGLFTEALQSLTQFIDGFPVDSRVAQAYFLRGEANLGLSSWQAAIDDFGQYLTLRPGIIDSYAHERIGDAKINLGLTQDALQSYEMAADASRTLPAKLALREKLAVSYADLGQWSQAIGQYDAILAEAQNPGYRALIEYRAAQLEIISGLTDTGFARLDAMMQQYPLTQAGYLAMLDLLNAGYTVDDWLRARIAFSAEDYQDALTALNRYTSSVEVVTPEVHLMVGRAYRALGNYPAAYTSFQAILDQYPEDPLYGLAWLEQGRTLFLENDYPNAIARYSALATTHPDAPQAAEALWRAGYLATQLQDTERALELFTALGTSYPGTEQAQDGLLMAATMAYNNGQLDRALSFYTQLANTGAGSAKAQAFLWLGKLYQNSGQMELARQSYTGAAQAAPGDYFSIRGEDLLNGREPFSPPPAYQFTFDDASQQAEAEQWLRDRFGIQHSGPLSPLSAPLDTDSRIVRGTELWSLALFEEAKAEFEDLREERGNDALSLYQLSMYYRDLGIYRSSIIAAAQLINLAKVTDFEAPRFLVRLRYPIYYADLVLPECEKRDVDPLLIFSLMRQESLYEGFATSTAAAQGLMQIIPSTGLEIYGDLGWPENYRNLDVYRPYVNVVYGVYYLKKVLTNFAEGQPYAALAGYNGGPGNAYTWLQVSGHDIDLFIQVVGFEETRLYVERIYEQYTIYKMLYGVGA